MTRGGRSERRQGRRKGRQGREGAETQPSVPSEGLDARVVVARWRMGGLALIGLLALVWAFGVDEAKSVSGWGTALMLVGLAAICAWLWHARWPGPPWWLCVAGFLAMAVDDYFLGFHDEVREGVRDGLEGSLGQRGALLVAAALLVVGAAAFARWFVIRLPRRTALHAGAGFVIAIFGAGVIDVMGGRVSVWVGRNSEWHRLSVVLEESLELVGVALVFLALFEVLLVARGASIPLPRTSNAAGRSEKECGDQQHVDAHSEHGGDRAASDRRRQGRGGRAAGT